MNLTRVSLHARKLLVACAATVVAATFVASGNHAEATTNHTRPAIHQATKEWKSAPSSSNKVVVATKEWKVGPFTTKEW